MSDTRINVLAEIARLYPDLVDPLNGPAGVRGTGEVTVLNGHDERCAIGTTLRCSCSRRTIVEYERLVKQMRDDRSAPLIELRGEKVSVRSLWWHLEHFWHRAERVIRHDPVTAKRGKKLVQLRNTDGSVATTPRLDYRRHRDANEAKALRAVEWIATHWGLSTEPMLPQAVVEKMKDPVLTERAA